MVQEQQHQETKVILLYIEITDNLGECNLWNDTLGLIVRLYGRRFWISYLDSPNTTSAITYKYYFKVSGGGTVNLT
jgi:hypothetical protein